MTKFFLKMGFMEENIHILEDNLATKKNILNTINKVFVLEASKGDILALHYSGRAQKVPDRNGDEVDGYDEALAAYDSKSKFISGAYEGENLLLDDELEPLIRKARMIIGAKGQFFMTTDRCHITLGKNFLGPRGNVHIEESQYSYTSEPLKIN